MSRAILALMFSSTHTSSQSIDHTIPLLYTLPISYSNEQSAKLLTGPQKTIIERFKPDITLTSSLMHSMLPFR